MSNWHKYDADPNTPRAGAEDGAILRDDEHEQGARITLKREEKFLSISSHIYGWINHTRFFNTVSEAMREYRSMKRAMGDVLVVVHAADSKDIRIWEAISEFVRRFP
ncbi:MAG: hypothetical protein K8S20_15100 [Chloroflexi bacterium]|jgi:hypothetical protein|nr:hypothetical protein [Chloroflexota bacterium]